MTDDDDDDNDDTIQVATSSKGLLHYRYERMHANKDMYTGEIISGKPRSIQVAN